jgi:hypothetical protein
MIPQKNLSELEEGVNEDIQQVYIEFFEKIEDINMHRIGELSRFCKVMPSENTAQKGYLNLFKSGRTQYIIGQKSFTGIEPDLEFEGMVGAIQEGYLKLFKRVSLNDIDKIKEFTGIEPDLEFKGMVGAIQEGYLACFEIGDIDNITELEEFTGIEPIIDDEAKKAIQKGYSELMSEIYFVDEVRGLWDYTGVKPIINEDHIQSKYFKFFEWGQIEDVKKIVELFGIKPAEELFFRYPEYVKYFPDCKTDKIKHLLQTEGYI